MRNAGLDWMADAACKGRRDLEWFPEQGGDDTRPAKAVCRSCPVIAECFEYVMSLQYSTPGVWAATSERERRRIRMGKRVMEFSPCLDCGERVTRVKDTQCDDCRRARRMAV